MRQLKQIHAQIITDDAFFPHETSLELSKLTSFCAVSPNGSLPYAKTIFNYQENPSIPLYNALIRGFCCSKHPLEAVALHKKMLQKGLKPNSMTYPFVIKACNELSRTQDGMLVLTYVVKIGLESYHYILSSLIHLYANGKDLFSARRLYAACLARDIGSGNSLIDGYVKYGNMKLAREVFDGMVYRDVISWNTMINGYGIIGDVDKAKRLFDGMPDRNIVSWNSMLACYAKCGNGNDAIKMFHEMPRKDVVSWNAMLACHAQCGKSNEALALFEEVKEAHVRPTETTMVSLLSACSHLGALDQGLLLHSHICDHNIEINSILGTALMDMYAKCGSISRAAEVFRSRDRKDILAWNTIITGMAMHGHAKEAEYLFKQMQEEGVVPNDITLVAMLSAFRHAGMIEEGRRLLICMGSSYGIDPKVEHYGCVIDLLSRAGRLEEAFDLMGNMPMEPNACAWGALLGGCMIHGDAEAGGRVGKRLLDLQPQHSGRYILLSNIYAAARRWDDARKVRNLMTAKGVAKVPGASVIEYVADDWSHPEAKHIYEKWCEISTRLKGSNGYSPDTAQVLVDLEEEEKEHALSVHSEKLAIAYGFLRLGPHEDIRIVKNLRVCGDCHNAIKLISRVYGREIIMRDRNRFHHFKDGSCSCLDFW
ncbi:hypothetical protein RJ640_029712 [Escallonia rubra]|uniref:DYW domain-containing protein n=1 Tax=Escallonia rubra TaxID=112253 RepID=A0AA88RDN8_9ASTE|nr:hypothetical protein RJ640_029712 [Escallonia rubra]